MSLPEWYHFGNITDIDIFKMCIRDRICIGSACHLKGSREVIQKLQKLVSENHLDSEVDLNGDFCSGNCRKVVSGFTEYSSPSTVTQTPLRQLPLQKSPFKSDVYKRQYVPSNGICRGFAFKYGKFLLPPRFLTALSVPKVPTCEQ